MKVYKLTDKDDFSGVRFGYRMKWGVGAVGFANPKYAGIGDLCGSGWIHWYYSPAIAVILDPLHVEYGSSAHLWIAEPIGEIHHDSLQGEKGGSIGLRALERIALPTIDAKMRCNIAACCALRFQHHGELPTTQVNELTAWLTEKKIPTSDSYYIPHSMGLAFNAIQRFVEGEEYAAQNRAANVVSIACQRAGVYAVSKVIQDVIHGNGEHWYWPPVLC